MITAKEYLHFKGLTNSPDKTMCITRGDESFDMALIMEQYASLVVAGPTVFEANEVQLFPHVYDQYNPRYINVLFKAGMQTGYLCNGSYYPIDGPVPRSMDRKYAVMTADGPKVVDSTTILIKDTETDKVIGIVKSK